MYYALQVTKIFRLNLKYDNQFAKNTGDIVVALEIDNPIMKINGAEFEVDEGRGTTPVIINGRTMVPIRAIIEAFGGAVGWDEDSKSVIITMDGDTVTLVIDSFDAYINGRLETLDTPPAIVNGRTMLPARFVAEGFGLGVAWNGDLNRVCIIKNLFEDNEYDRLMTSLPEYSGDAYVFVNNNKPFFEEYEIIDGAFEYYSKPDELERCGVCFSSVEKSLMPVEERGNIGSVTPTGWKNAEYSVVSGGYLYNRCHLIGFQLTGENDNERNLITGTRYLNIDGMLSFENEIAEYVMETGNNVMYRSTPVFTDDNLLCDGVLLEAYSVEDNGEGISFCVFCYNVQPGVIIDYKTGESREDENYTPVVTVYRTPFGKKYHYDAECGGENSYEISLEKAEEDGLTPCLKCVNGGNHEE